jgi:hypothetical protein
VVGNGEYESGLAVQWRDLYGDFAATSVIRVEQYTNLAILSETY